ncbi:DUF3375 domain-containing protein [Agromyces italicus]|uniref:DUF3375 domain-containing protein n=1 Tax=Agromyces italicus TaxID=279572 RepID=UPI0003B3E84F|nr:DUF3375 domain-containing protein [Agromyces italicus]
MPTTTLETHGALKRARDLPTWQLLAADNAKEVITVLYTNFIVAGQPLIATGRFHERVADDLRTMNRLAGSRMLRPAADYCSTWVDYGWLERRPDQSGDGETYELTPEVYTAIDVVTRLVTPTSGTTSSQVASLFAQLDELNVQTNPNSQARLDALYARQAATQTEIDQLLDADGEPDPLDEERALESARGILNSVRTSGADFARLRRDLSHTVDDLRRRALETDGNRGDLLETVLSQTDLRATEQGRSFVALYELLDDIELRAKVGSSIRDILSRPFAAKLSHTEREGLRDMVGELRRRAGDVHQVVDTLMDKLRSYVEERQYAQERLIDQALRTALKEFGRLAETESLRTKVPFELPLSVPEFRSIGQWALGEVHASITDELIDHSADDTEQITLDDVFDLAEGADIDFHTLRERITGLLAARTVVTIGDIIADAPDLLDIADVIGLILIAGRGTDNGVTAVIRDTEETVSWAGGTTLRIPKILFHESETQHA